MNNNKWLLIVTAIWLLMAMPACENKATQQETVLRRGILYLKGADEPFTGIVTGKGREDYRRKVCTFKKEYKDGLKHGVTCYWYENGKLESKENYVEGKLHGLVTRFYSSGKPKARLHFEHGLRGGGKGEMYWDDRGREINK